jgi:hypothetical protein
MGDVLTLAGRLAYDAARGGSMLSTLGEAGTAAANRLVEHSRSGINSAFDKIRTWVQPVVDQIEVLGQNLPSTVDAATAAGMVDSLLSQVAASAEQLTAAQLRAHLATVFGVLQGDLGLTNQVIETQAMALFDDAIARLGQLPPEPDDSLHRNRVETLVIFRRIRRQLRGKVLLPDLNADRLAGQIVALLQRGGLTRLTEKVACLAGSASDAFAAGATITRLAPYSGFGAQSVGAARSPAAREQYCWYASWLLEHRNQSFWLRWLPGDKVWIDGERTKVSLGDEVLHSGTNVDWPQIPLFTNVSGERYTFKHVSPEFLEGWAKHSSWGADTVEIIAHLASLEEGDIVSNVLNSFLNVALISVKLGLDSPLSGLNIPAAAHAEWLIRLGLTLAASFEGVYSESEPGNWFMYWLTLAGADVTEMLLFTNWVGMSREATLSFITLLNYEGPRAIDDFPDPRPDDRPLNRKETAGVANLFVELFAWILALAVPKDDYSQPFDDDTWAKNLFGYHLGGSLGMALAGGLIGSVVAQSIAWAEDWEALGLTLLKAFPQIWLKFWPYLFVTHENDTDGGTYNPAKSPAIGGYPSKDTPSPYRLPWEAGKSRQCGQGNQGIWSHTPFSNGPQVYAFDFSLDEDEEVLASRGGTVVDFFDWVEDNEHPDSPGVGIPKEVTDVPGAVPSEQTTESRRNFIRIRHDVYVEGHDPRADDTDVVTFADYLHGRKDSIRRMFARHLGVAMDSITPA